MMTPSDLGAFWSLCIACADVRVRAIARGSRSVGSAKVAKTGIWQSFFVFGHFIGTRQQGLGATVQVQAFGKVYPLCIPSPSIEPYCQPAQGTASRKGAGPDLAALQHAARQYRPAPPWRDPKSHQPGFCDPLATVPAWSEKLPSSRFMTYVRAGYHRLECRLR